MAWIAKTVVFLICVASFTLGTNSSTSVNGTMAMTMNSTNVAATPSMMATSSVNVVATVTAGGSMGGMTSSPSMPAVTSSATTNNMTTSMNTSMNTSGTPTQSSNGNNTTTPGEASFLVPCMFSLILLAISSIVFHLV